LPNQRVGTDTGKKDSTSPDYVKRNSLSSFCRNSLCQVFELIGSRIWIT